MAQPNETVVLYITQSTNPDIFWERLQDALAEHQLFFYRQGKRALVSVDNTLGIGKQLRDEREKPSLITLEEWERFVKCKFLSCKKYIWIFELCVEGWDDQVGPSDLWIVKLPFGKPWTYHLQINCNFWCIRRYATFWEHIMALSKTLFTHLSADFGVACFEDILPRHLWIFRTEKAIRFLPTLPGSRQEQLQVLSKLFPNLSEGELEDWFQPSDLWGWKYPWGDGGYLPASFYLLNKDYYEASKPYLPNLPVEAIERFPGLKGYGVKRIEELPNGGAFILLGYPYQFDEP